MSLTLLKKDFDVIFGKKALPSLCRRHQSKKNDQKNFLPINRSSKFGGKLR